MTDILLFIIAWMLYLIYRELPSRRYTEIIMKRIAAALETIAEKGKRK